MGSEMCIRDRCTDHLKWIDTTVMLVDCFTKFMRDNYLTTCLEENYWDYSQTESAKELKQKRKVSRQSCKTESKRPIALDLGE